MQIVNFRIFARISEIVVRLLFYRAFSLVSTISNSLCYLLRIIEYKTLMKSMTTAFLNASFTH